MSSLSFLGLAIVATWLQVPAAAADLSELEEQACRSAAQYVAPAVVSIETVGGLERVGDRLAGTGLTTGLIVSSDGYLVSSAYNFAQKPASILVGLPDGSRTPATLVATDRVRMLVLLKVTVDEPLPTPLAAQRVEPIVGRWSIAVGRSFDRSQVNISVGIVSGANRIWGKALQTDAKISPSNYGGPLVDLRGGVLGVLVPMAPDKSGVAAGLQWYDSGIGFAVPFDQVLTAVERLKAGHDLEPGILGVVLKPGDSYADPVIVEAARPNSPAWEAGLKRGDRVTSLDGRPLNRRIDLTAELQRRYAGDTVRLSIQRFAEQVEVVVKLVDRLEPYDRPWLGVLPVRGVEEPQSPGVKVRFLFPNSPAANAGLKVDDRIVSVNGRAVASATDLSDALAHQPALSAVQLSMVRAGRPIDVEVQLGSNPAIVPAELPPALTTTALAQPRDTKSGLEIGEFPLELDDYANECTVYAPKSLRTHGRLGLFVWLHGDEGSDLDAALKNWRATSEEDGFLLVLPTSVSQTKWSIKDLEFLDAAISQLVADYPIDPLRVIVVGNQTGGALATVWATQSPELIRGVAIANAPFAAQPPETDPEHRLSWLITTTTKDANRPKLEALRSMKHPVTLIEQGDKARTFNDDERALVRRWFDSLDRL